MYYLNKAIWSLANPTIVLWVLIALGVYGVLARKPQKIFRVLLVGSLALMWLWMTPLMMLILGVPLEREWLVDGKVPKVETFPSADAIVLLGGGMGGATNVSEYAEMCSGSDRPWQAARLYRAGKAPKIIVSGRGNEWSTKDFLVDMGVPTNALVFLDEPRNTEQEAKAISRLFDCSNSKPKVLLVTSAWHMKRAKLMFEKYASVLDVVPAPADFEAVTTFAYGFRITGLIPDCSSMASCECYFHEWLGYWGYKLLR